jgi:hypothetical protein
VWRRPVPDHSQLYLTRPNPSPELLGFLSKDVLLFGIAVWLTGQSLRAAAPGEHC